MLKAAAASWRALAILARVGATRCKSCSGYCSVEGCPIAIEVFEGNTGDPATLANQIAKLKERFGLQRVIMVGDRGMITHARIEQELKPAGFDWITALRAPAIQKLAAENGPLQLSWVCHVVGYGRADCR